MELLTYVISGLQKQDVIKSVIFIKYHNNRLSSLQLMSTNSYLLWDEVLMSNCKVSFFP